MFVTTAVLVTGCISSMEPRGNGPVAIQRAGATILLAVCKPLTMDSIYLQESTPGHSANLLWHFYKTVRFSPDASYSQADLRGDGEMVAPEPTMVKGNAIEIDMTSTLDGPVTAAFLIEAASLSSKTWLHPDGSTSISPCPPK